MRIRIHRTDGMIGKYHQDVGSRAKHLVERFDPRSIFSSGPIVIGVLNPFSVLNPDEVCWIEVDTDYQTKTLLPENIDQILLLEGRSHYESVLAQQWPLWMKFKRSTQGDLLEALVELSLRSGESLFLRVFGHVDDLNLIDAIFGLPAITATTPPHVTTYINPKTIVRARVYHSKDHVNYPSGLWVAEADDL